VRAVLGGAPVTVATEDAFVVDRPDLLPLLRERPWVPVDVALAGDLAHVLGVRRASALGARVTSTPTGTARLADLASGAPDVGVDLHDPLLLDGIPVSWVASPPSTDGSPAGVARLAAWLAGDWPSRYAREAALRGDDPAERLLDP
jgi:hypothetical protein